VKQLLILTAVSFYLLGCGNEQAHVAKNNSSLKARSGIVTSVRENDGLCCRISRARVRGIKVTRDGRFATAGVTGGNDIQGARVVLWHGTVKWAVVDYGTERCEGYGYVPLSDLGELSRGKTLRGCRALVENSLRKSIVGALKSDPNIVNLYENENVERVRIIKRSASNNRYVRVAVELSSGSNSNRTRTRHVLLRKGTQLWAAVDVRAKQRDLGCGLITNAERERLKLTNRCS
jgi:hypothetical protein